jgi:fucose permease
LIASVYPVYYVFLCQSAAAAISLCLITYFEHTRAELLLETSAKTAAALRAVQEEEEDAATLEGFSFTEKGCRSSNSATKSTVEIVREYYGILSRVAVLCAILMLLRTARKFLLPVLATGFELSPLEVGIAVSWSYAVDVLFFPLAGKLSDQCGRKFSAGPAILIMSIGFMLLPAAKDFTGLMLVGGLLGFGNSLSKGGPTSWACSICGSM